MTTACSICQKPLKEHPMRQGRHWFCSKKHSPPRQIQIDYPSEFDPGKGKGKGGKDSSKRDGKLPLCNVCGGSLTGCPSRVKNKKFCTDERYMRGGKIDPKHMIKGETYGEASPP